MLRTRDHHHKTIQGDYTVIRKSSYILSNTNARPLELKSLWIYIDSNKWKVVKFMNDDEKMLAGAPKIHTVNKAVTGTWSQGWRKSGKGKKKHTDRRCLAHDLKKKARNFWDSLRWPDYLAFQPIEYWELHRQTGWRPGVHLVQTTIGSVSQVSKDLFNLIGNPVKIFPFLWIHQPNFYKTSRVDSSGLYLRQSSYHREPVPHPSSQPKRCDFAPLRISKNVPSSMESCAVLGRSNASGAWALQ